MRTANNKAALSRRHLIMTFSILAGAATVIGILVKGLSLNPDMASTALVGKPAHPFRVSWLQGHEHIPDASPSSLKLADLADRPLILNFWASWCVSCQSEAAVMEQFWQQHKDDGLLIVGIAVQDSAEAAAQFAHHYGKSYPLALDTDGNASIEYGVTGVPETFFIDRKGMIQHKVAGPVDTELLESMLPKISGSGTEHSEAVPHSETR
ncbi:MAG: TlpA family protein disulfide reductase [Deltaproteobacteria bacterium]|nr:TlpA family protein disulfide reductase [Deltaproteobacteria bacterium]